MKKKSISIIIPCYNVENYIVKCLNSIEKQLTGFKYDIILVDDASTDNTKKVIEDYIKKSNLNISLICNESNKGAGYSRNKAVQIAKSDYISFIDSDDYLDDNFYAELLDVANNTDADVVVCDINCVYEDGTPSIIAPGCEGKTNKENIINTGFAASPCNKLINRELLLEYPFAEGIMNEDVASILAIVANCSKIEYTSKTRYNYVQRSSSVQNSKFSMKRFDIFKSVELLETRLANNKQKKEIIEIVTFQQLFMFFLYVIPREKNMFLRAKYMKKFKELSKKYHLENNKYCKADLERRGRKAKFYFSTIFNLNNKGCSLLASFIISSYQIYHNIKYSKLFVRNFSVIKKNITMKTILDAAKKQHKLKQPKISVSVVIPNYNYEQFLFQRIYSILSQDYKIQELILLDDNSHDNSQELLDKVYETISPYVNVVKYYNKENSGSAFKQWKLGFSLAKSDYVWIAEADDYCEKNLLSSLMKPILKDNEIVLSYADTTFINTVGLKQFKSIKPEIDILKTGHWDKDFVNDGINEIKDYCYLNCTIANVSSCVMKNADYSKELHESGTYKQAGDWLFYINVIKRGKIAFKNQVLNYYRVHGNNVTSVTKKEQHIKEILKVHDILKKEFKLTKKHEKNMQKRIEFLKRVWNLE